MTEEDLVGAVRTILAAPKWPGIAKYNISVVHWREGPRQHFVSTGWIASVLENPASLDCGSQTASSAARASLELGLTELDYSKLTLGAPGFDAALRAYALSTAGYFGETSRTSIDRVEGYLAEKGEQFAFWVHQSDYRYLSDDARLS